MPNPTTNTTHAPPAYDSSPQPLPSVHDALHSPLRPDDIVDRIPLPARHSFTILLIRLVLTAARTQAPDRAHAALLRLHLLPTAVLRRLLRGEPGWRCPKRQAQALRDRIRRATAGDWQALWNEAVAASEHRETLRPPRSGSSPRASSTHTVLPRRKLCKAQALAGEAQYGKAVRVLQSNDLADVHDPAVIAQLQALHPTPPTPIIPISDGDLPPSLPLSEDSVLAAVRHLNPNSAPGPDRFPPRLFHLLAKTSVSPEAGVSGLSALTLLIQRLADGNVPPESLPLIASATLVPVRVRSDKIRPIAIGTSLRRLVTKVLLPPAIADTSDYLAPLQVANKVRFGIDSVVHETRRAVDEHKCDAGRLLLKLDARNAFNEFSRQAMLDLLPSRAPSLARFINMVYGRATPALILPSPDVADIASLQGAQQGDPAAMLLFSLVIHPLARAVDQATSLDVHRWYADDSTLVGRHEDICTAVEIIKEQGPALGFHINPTKSTLFWPVSNPQYPSCAAVLAHFPTCTIAADGTDVLGAPIGNEDFTKTFLRSKISACQRTLGLIAQVPEARTRFHLHRVTASVCRINHVASLTRPDAATTRLMQAFDRSQMRHYAASYDVPLTANAKQQVCLPMRLGGHGFIPAAPLHFASYAASLLSAEKQRADPDGPQDDTRKQVLKEANDWILEFVKRLHVKCTNGYGGPPPEHDAVELLTRSDDNLRNVLYKAWCESAALFCWQDDHYGHRTDLSALPVAIRRMRARRHAFLETPAAAFLSAHPANATHTPSPMWSVMLRRHLGLPVYDDTARPLRCAECTEPMDAGGDHGSDLCKKGLGWNNRHSAVVRVFGHDVFRAAGAGTSYEVPYLVPGLNLRPADILVHPLPSPGSEAPPRETAYDVTITSPFATGALNKAASGPRALANSADDAKRRKLGQRLISVPRDSDTPLQLGWGFQPLAFDSLGTPSDGTTKVIEEYSTRIAARTGPTPKTVQTRIYQKLSYAIWSACAASILGRAPQHTLEAVPSQV